MKTKQITINAMLAAMCAVLGYISVDLGNFKFTFEGVPIIFAALLFGPVQGAVVGGIGIFVYQLMRYGIQITTPLWILPYIAAALVAGLIARKKNYNLSKKEILAVTMLFGIILTTLNTGAIYLDSVIGGYYSKAYVFGSLAMRFVVCIIKYLAIGLLLPTLIDTARKAVLKGE